MPPKGWKKQKEGETRTVPETESEIVADVQNAVEPKRVVVDAKTDHVLDAISESRKALDHGLEPNQAFFEAPDGFIIVGEASMGKMYYRAGNGGKGMWINPRRV